MYGLTRCNPRFPFLTERVSNSIDFLYQEENAGDDKPFPEVGGVQDEEDPVEDVQQM